MARMHFLNVDEGDCSIIQHNSGRITVIDVCNAEGPQAASKAVASKQSLMEKGINGNFQQKKYPVNPISYLQQIGATSIFRYIQTHPDMDHMDGIKALFEHFRPLNFWDTDNEKEMDGSQWPTSRYTEADWTFYTDLRNGKPEHDPKRLALLAGNSGRYWSLGEGDQAGDGLRILAPTKTLLEQAIAKDDYNDCSYVLLYRTAHGKRILFAGDSHDQTWQHILHAHTDDVMNVDLLIAPHHGRDSSRSYAFLDTLHPTLTLFGNARAQHLAYDAWNNRNLDFVTNNQANCVVVEIGASLGIYVTHEPFARRRNPASLYDKDIGGWFLMSI